MFPKCQHFTNICFIILYLWQFFAGQVVKAPHFPAEDPGSIPGWGATIPQAVQYPPRQGLRFGGGKGLCFYKTPFLCALPLLLLAAGSAGKAPGAVPGQLTALDLGNRGRSPLLASWARGVHRARQHSQAGVWLPTLSGTSDQPLSLSPGSL